MPGLTSPPHRRQPAYFDQALNRPELWEKIGNISCHVCAQMLSGIPLSVETPAPVKTSSFETPFKIDCKSMRSRKSNGSCDGTKAEEKNHRPRQTKYSSSQPVPILSCYTTDRRIWRYLCNDKNNRLIDCITTLNFELWFTKRTN
uniref:Uncharacterized protein n=1 Tax=Romanomermis culicivorax TaxID=13658 RepID=A0A915K976_ROMCU